MPPANKSGDELITIVKELYSKTDASVKELSTRIDTFRDEHRDRLDKYREDAGLRESAIRREYEAKFEKVNSDLTVLKTESKSYTRNWGTIIGIVASIISGLMMFLLTKGLK